MHNPAMLPAGAPGSIRGRFPARALAAAIALLGIALGAAGCGSDIDNRPAKWSFISATITEPGCATVACHSAVAQRAGVNLSARDVGFDSLVMRNFVIPGDPIDSPVVFLMHAQGSIRMPPDLPLPEVDIQLFERWILNGANND
jgi:hypothetical protein